MSNKETITSNFTQALVIALAALLATPALAGDPKATPTTDNQQLPAGYRQGLITSITVVLTGSLLFFRFVVFEPSSGPWTKLGAVTAILLATSLLIQLFALWRALQSCRRANTSLHGDPSLARGGGLSPRVQFGGGHRCLVGLLASRAATMPTAFVGHAHCACGASASLVSTISRSLRFDQLLGVFARTSGYSPSRPSDREGVHFGQTEKPKIIQWRGNFVEDVLHATLHISPITMVTIPAAKI